MPNQPTHPTRRELLQSSLAAAALTLVGADEFNAMTTQQAAVRAAITDVAGIKVGHFTDARRPTGCTVILCEEGATAGVDVRGAAPGTRETDLLDPVNTVQQIHAVVLSGGSSFGLDTATGVMRYLEEKGIGIQTAAAKIPIVPAAIIYDLSLGDAKIRPNAEAGYKACHAATTSTPTEGNIGAGTGATVGKLFGLSRAMKGGLGTASIKLTAEKTNAALTVGAIVVVNAIGDVYDPQTGKVIAGARTKDGKALLNAMNAILRGEPLPPLLGGTATTIGVVATDARLNKVQANKIAQMAHDGLARTINPIHTTGDGDAIFAIATGKSARPANVTLIGALAAEAMAQAVVRAVRAAGSVADLPSAADVKDE